MLNLDISDITIIIVKVINYCCIISYISKSATIHLKNILCLIIADLYKMHFKQVNFKNKLNYYETTTTKI